MSEARLSDLGFLEKLLDGAEVEWVPLGELTTVKAGQSVSKNLIAENPGDFPVINSGVKPLGYANVWNTENDPIGVTTRGAGVGSITWQEGKYFRGNLNYSVSVKSGASLAVRFLYHLLLEMQTEIHSLCTFDGIPALNAGRLKGLSIPIPCPKEPEKSLAIQREIVRILDSFTQLTAELTAELAMRKKQYNHYRDSLLTFEDGEVEWKTLSEVFEMRAGHHIKAAEIESQASETHPFKCFGGNGVRGFVRNKSHDGDYLLIGRQGALCGNVQRVKGPFYATEHAVVVTSSEVINVDWAYHYLTVMNLNQYKSKSAQPGLAVGKLLGLKIPVPPIEDQDRTASILDKFDTLTTSLSTGLPREIELRQKQYEYYRDLLLSFPNKSGPKPAETTKAAA
ncbi:restriction endonuclease [Sphingorhabdus lutea]|uniref:Restriction endonuclease n=1 Tax=Sphingorhabdus lutea TaxID=1913578 RepID=A0A1L3J9X9_9SPHN|nr:restriction endonuclease subunit S [Sphingorhabdus lutea]APG61936.1 restriction endonuclease [Sphingorhabdus lutea]